ncbi:unnamed protein product [Phyllotreta striolata]|uniref:Centriolar and ciliogenesis-associated protein HYLS1 C-terminal domain-containing protein n=1 Tax=Phyllotreta striolata TaxID=444603 RepID=A0A9N9TZH5_PHYSR|nr:unnamed protein product [Phyllotreta striolata]
MSVTIDPRDVLSYLNELGYTNISAQQLKEFIIDLKKIIKYEWKRMKHLEQNEHSNNTLSTVHSSISTKFQEESSVKQKSTKSSKPDIFETLYNLPTEAFKAKIANKPDKPPIAIHIKQSKKKIPSHDHCVHVENVNAREQTNINDKICSDCCKASVETTEKLNNEESKTDPSKTDTELESGRTSGLRPNSKQSRTSSSKSTKLKKSKTQVLRAPSRKTISKSDPVALYQEYQKQWKTIKFPGEQSHLDLRWAIREKLMDGPVVEIKKKPSAKKIPFT